jgi:hypothetical protein
MTPTGGTELTRQPAITSDEALRIARLDGEAYGDLSSFHIAVALEADGWHVDYDLKDPNLNGGGPHYIIDPADGRIVWKIYEQ